MSDLLIEYDVPYTKTSKVRGKGSTPRIIYPWLELVTSQGKASVLLPVYGDADKAAKAFSKWKKEACYGAYADYQVRSNKEGERVRIWALSPKQIEQIEG